MGSGAPSELSRQKRGGPVTAAAMKIEITKGRDADAIAIRRDDGSRVETRFPHKGPVPHDAVHLFVERGLDFGNAFWGHVAGGMHPEAIAALAKAGGHASASRAQVPMPALVELIQAERLVECFEADLWSGGGVDADLLAVAEAGCVASHVPMPEIDPAAISRVREEIVLFARHWRVAPEGHLAVLYWPTIAA